MMHFCIILYAEYKFHRCITMGFICIISVTDTADIFKRSSQVLLDWTLKKSFNRKGFQECPFWKLKWFGLINSWNCWVFSCTKSLFFFFSQSFFYQMVTKKGVQGCHFEFFTPLYICDNEIHAIKYFFFSVVDIIYHKTHEFESLFSDKDRWLCFGLNINEGKEELSNYAFSKISIISTPFLVL